MWWKDWGCLRGYFAGFVLLVLLNASMGGCSVDVNKYKFGPPLDAMTGGSAQGGRSTAGAGSGGRTSSGGQGANGGQSSSGGAANATGGDAGTGGGPSVVVDPGQVGDGMACLKDGDCMSRFCRDGVCCKDQCDGACQACSSTYTQLDNGVCGPVKTGIDPHDDCMDESGANPCGEDGQCDGAGKCRQYPLGRSCADPECTDASTFVPDGTCDGKGTCTAGVAVNCGQYPCATTGCAKPCTGDGECPNGSYCTNGTCRTKKLSGDACGAASECRTGFCSPDQVCCDDACTGACMACSDKLTGQPTGSCAFVKLGLDPRDDCTAESASSCSRDGSCDGKGACHLYDSGTPCKEGACAGAAFTPGKICNGTGLCAASGTAQDCGSNACSADGCATSCTIPADCASGSTCVLATHVCTPKKINGSVCTLGSDCTSNACVDGVCCESACADKCYACSSAKTGGTSGKCLPVKVGTDLDNDCALADSSTCGQDGTCNGNGECRLWSDGTQCVAGSCNTSGNYVSPRTCSQGTCRTATTDVCAPAVCDATTGCKRTCTVKGDCIGATYCNTTTKICAAQKTPGLACGNGEECISGYCADGVCCNNPCNGTCVSCLAKDNGLQADGTCGNVKDATDPASECAVGATTCGLDGTCGGGKCRLAASTTSCGTTTCSGSTLTPQSKCDGNGTCPAVTGAACPGHVTCASASACRSATCAADTDCVSGYYCGSGTCKLKNAQGGACTAGSGTAQCSTGTCSPDGVCCNSACTLSCQACKAATTGAADGTCAPKKPASPIARDVALCGGACPTNYGPCTNAAGSPTPVCNPLTWNFEGGSPSDWQDSLAPVNFNQTVPGGAAHSGIWTLSSFGNQVFPRVSPWESRLYTGLCANHPNQGIDVHGKTLKIYYYAPTPAATGSATCTMEYTGWDTAGDGFDGNPQTISVTSYNTWNLFSYTFPANVVVYVSNIIFDCNIDGWSPTSPNTQVLYFDDITIN